MLLMDAAISGNSLIGSFVQNGSEIRVIASYAEQPFTTFIWLAAGPGTII